MTSPSPQPPAPNLSANLLSSERRKTRFPPECLRAACHLSEVCPGGRRTQGQAFGGVMCFTYFCLRSVVWEAGLSQGHLSRALSPCPPARWAPADQGPTRGVHQAPSDHRTNIPLAAPAEVPWAAAGWPRSVLFPCPLPEPPSPLQVSPASSLCPRGLPTFFAEGLLSPPSPHQVKSLESPTYLRSPQASTRIFCENLMNERVKKLAPECHFGKMSKSRGEGCTAMAACSPPGWSVSALWISPQ